ncbi:MAG: hypothetical protein MI923_25160 [Phycisphaerales bacterium]|nr:hypothetical protein [Phycisphaerales bacterium]
MITVAIVLIPFRGIWDSPASLLLAGISAVLLGILTFTVKQLRALAAVALVMIAWQAMMAVEQRHLPEGFQGLAPHRVNDLSSGL